MAVGGGQACLFEGLDIIKIAKMNDIVSVIQQ
jgi:hypothetical protein